MYIIDHRKIFYFVSVALVSASILSIIIYGLNLGIDFKGGTLIEVKYSEEKPQLSDLSMGLEKLSLGGVLVRPTGEKGFLIRTKTLVEGERNIVVNAIKEISKDNKYELTRFNSIGPIIGKETGRKSLMSISLVLICIILFIAFAFRHVSEPVSSWKYGVIAVVALMHDVIIPTGIFSILGQFNGIEVDALFVTAILVILGFSVHDTIVVFDRVRENLKINRIYKEKKSFEKIVGESIRQTFTRSINTSLTTVLVLFVLFLIGSDSTKYFSLALIIGISVGTYSSIFLCSPLLVTVEKWQEKKK